MDFIDNVPVTKLVNLRQRVFQINTIPKDDDPG